jgi:hypothetical protein
MALTLRQERLLRRADRALCQSDPDLAAMLSIFTQMTAADRLPAREQLQSKLTRAWSVLLWPLAAVVFLVVFIVGGGSRAATNYGVAVHRRALDCCMDPLRRKSNAVGRDAPAGYMWPWRTGPAGS